MASRVDVGCKKYSKSIKMVFSFYWYSGEDRILSKLEGCLRAIYVNYH